MQHATPTLTKLLGKKRWSYGAFCFYYIYYPFPCSPFLCAIHPPSESHKFFTSSRLPKKLTPKVSVTPLICQMRPGGVTQTSKIYYDEPCTVLQRLGPRGAGLLDLLRPNGGSFCPQPTCPQSLLPLEIGSSFEWEPSPPIWPAASLATCVTTNLSPCHLELASMRSATRISYHTFPPHNLLILEL